MSRGVLRMFYFSGTGNARNVAHWIEGAWRERGREVEVANIAKTDPAAVHVGEDDEVGIASPTHGFNFPPITLSFLFAFPRAPQRNRAFILNTRAGLRFFGVCLPGLSGVAQLLAALVLVFKGYRVIGMRGIDLPSNWISVHPGLRDDNVRAIYARCRAITLRFAERLLDGRRDLRSLWFLPRDLLIAPISLGYYFIGRFFFAKSFIASRDCDGCGSCEKQCPVKAVKLYGGRPFWTWRCESCMRCMNQCPRRAIQTAHGFIFAVVLLLWAIMRWVVVPSVGPYVPDWLSAGRTGELARFTLDSFLILALLFAAYRVLYRAMALRVVERVVVATSLTHFSFWRRYRAPRDPGDGPMRP